uniref:rRNA N-glycosidase n=1 Tax=Cannabis sativa TaxID=3483 RepID=A0A803PV50_CANSA
MSTRRVLFLRNSDNYLLTAVEKDGLTYLTFVATYHNNNTSTSGNGAIASAIANASVDKNAQFDIIDAGQNRVRIQCIGNGKFWKLDRTHNWIRVEDVEIATSDSLFLSVLDGLSYTAYQNVGNRMYCKTFTKQPVMDCVMASGSDLTDAVKLIPMDI